MRVQYVDPPAFTLPYDYALAGAVAAAGAEVELLTAPFRHGTTPPAQGFRVTELFYRRSTRVSGPRPIPGLARAAEHVADLARLRRDLVGDVAHYHWLPAPWLDAAALPRDPPRVLTAHYILPQRPTRRQILTAKRTFRPMDAVIAHSQDAVDRLGTELGIEARRIHLIRHGVFDYLTRLPEERQLPREFENADHPVILFFGLLRRVKGIDTLLDAFRRIDGAELWIAGMPKMPMEPLRELAAGASGPVRFLPRFIDEEELPEIFRHADIIALPHRDTEHSGVLHIALAFGKPIVMTDVGGLPEVGRETGAALVVPPDDPEAMAAALSRLVHDDDLRLELAAAARNAAAGPYSWQQIARQTLAVYGKLLTSDRGR
jgi:glycosyltransferase involved in cell wall biosynthesis